MGRKGDGYREEMITFISSYQSQRGYAPSYREIAGAVGMPSINKVYRYMRILEQEGRIIKPKSKARAVQVLPKAIGSTESVRADEGL